MDITIFFKALVIGFTVAAAVGPIGLLCVQRTLQRGWRVGFISGVGVATADALYGLIGGLGLTVITSFLVGQQLWLRLVGGLVLVYIGVKALRAKQMQAAKDKQAGTGDYLTEYVSIFFLTLSNPMTIIFFAGIYAGIGELGVGSGWAAAGPFALGIFLGSVVWWLVLITTVNLVRHRFKPEMLLGLNKLTGVVIAGFGVWIVWQAF